MTKTVLVTGGSGYFGTTLIKKLQEDGYKCRNFDISKAYQNLDADRKGFVVAKDVSFRFFNLTFLIHRLKFSWPDKM